MKAPHIWIPKKIIETRDAHLLTTKMRGRFKLEVLRPDGRVRLVREFPNLITDAGLNVIGTSGSWLAACRVGTGTATPNVADTALASHLAGTGTLQANTSSAQSTPPYYGMRTRTYRFAAGVAAGNVAEVGIATQTAPGGTLFSRALVLDGDGDPTTITVLSDEVLDVTYQLQYFPQEETVGVATIGGVDYDVTTRASDVTNSGFWASSGTTGGLSAAFAYNGAIGAVTTSPSGSSDIGTETQASYGNNNLYRDTTLSWGLNTANFGGAGVRAMSARLDGLSSSAMGKIQIGFANDDSPSLGIPKTSSQILSVVCRHTWARGTPVI